ncbi:MAG TPA: hypothetical protein VKA48_12155 [Gammaproteobacteria bacterium]|nr:hypothetical protein [Gammaproteobacteria bacterium]
MQIRLLIAITVFLLGFYIGRQVERADPVREHLRRLENGPEGEGNGSPAPPAAGSRREP